MSESNGIIVEGVIIEKLPNEKCRVKLANGHNLVAFKRKRDNIDLNNIVPGNKIILEVMPYDLSKGRVLKVGE